MYFLNYLTFDTYVIQYQILRLLLKHYLYGPLSLLPK